MMSALRLYEIANDYKYLLQDLFDEETGEINELSLARLQALKDPLDTKCINIVKVFKEFEKEYTAISAERKAMQKREQAFKSQIDYLKSYLQTNMESCQVNKIECPQFVISLQKNPQSVDAYDKSIIPEEYKKITIDWDIQKMKDDMKSGTLIPGARLIQKNSLRIK
jgi:hypothetical protein